MPGKNWKRPLIAVCATLASASAGLAYAEVATALEPIGRTVMDLQALLAQETNGMKGGRVTPLWLSDGSSFLYTENGPGDLAIFLAEPSAPRIRQLTRDADLRAALTVATGTSAGELQVRIDGLSADAKTLYLRVNRESFFAVDLATNSVTSAPDYERAMNASRAAVISNQFPTTYGDLVEAPSPDGRYFVTVHNDNLFLRLARDGSLRQLTSDGTSTLTWLNTEESAQSFNVFWSPDSQRIATVQLDARGVWHEPLVHWLDTPPRIELLAFPRAAQPMQRFRLVIIDAASGRQTPIDSGDTQNQYVDLLGWRADGKAVFYQVFDREQKSVQFFSADVGSGDRTALFSEHSPTYVDTHMTLGMDFFYPLHQSNGFLFLSDRDGWRHLYRFDAQGKLVARLTRGAWPIEELVALDEEGGWVYFRASRDGSAPYDLQLFRVRLTGGEPQQLTFGRGAHTIAMAPSKRYFVSTRAGPEVTPVAELYAADGRLIKTLSRSRIDALLAAGFGGAQELTAVAADGSSVMHGMLVRPYHFDATKRFAVVEIIYGGMQAINVPHASFAASGMGSAPIVGALTSAGFAVAVVDAPGTPGRGKAFQDATYGTWPQGVIANHVRWLQAAAKQNAWLDLSRVGIYGHSWGGYMAQLAMIDAPQLYKVGVSHAAPSDLVDHSTYIEPFLGLPEHNPRAYSQGSVLARINEIVGPLLVMDMPLDANAGFSPGMKLVDALIRAGKDFDLFIAPTSNHRMNCCGAPLELYQVALVQRYFRAHLLATAGAPPGALQ
jgi:dipeptidyl-peptidase-4